MRETIKASPSKLWIGTAVALSIATMAAVILILSRVGLLGRAPPAGAQSRSA